MPRDPIVWTGHGTVSVSAGDQRETVYVAGTPGNRWAFWNGHVFHAAGGSAESAGRSESGRGTAAHELVAPMPATVIKVLAAPGDAVANGEAVLILEAMKMELPVRALGDGRVKAVHCRAGDLVQADQVLVELE